MIHAREVGYTSIVVNDGEYRLPLSEFEQLEAALTNGTIWLKSTTLYGAEVTIRASEVECISSMPAASITEWLDNKAEEYRADEKRKEEL